MKQYEKVVREISPEQAASMFYNGFDIILDGERKVSRGDYIFKDTDATEYFGGENWEKYTYSADSVAIRTNNKLNAFADSLAELGAHRLNADDDITLSDYANDAYEVAKEDGDFSSQYMWDNKATAEQNIIRSIMAGKTDYIDLFLEETVEVSPSREERKQAAILLDDLEDVKILVDYARQKEVGERVVLATLARHPEWNKEAIEIQRLVDDCGYLTFVSDVSAPCKEHYEEIYDFPDIKGMDWIYKAVQCEKQGEACVVIEDALFECLPEALDYVNTELASFSRENKETHTTTEKRLHIDEGEITLTTSVRNERYVEIGEKEMQTLTWDEACAWMNAQRNMAEREKAELQGQSENTRQMCFELTSAGAALLKIKEKDAPSKEGNDRGSEQKTKPNRDDLEH